MVVEVPERVMPRAPHAKGHTALPHTVDEGTPGTQESVSIPLSMVVVQECLVDVFNCEFYRGGQGHVKRAEV